MTAPAAADLCDWSQEPLRRGRHRNKALAAYRRSRAIEMAARGSTYQAIADDLGYANRGTVYRIVHQALEAQQVQNVDLLREVEVRRLDALQRGLWEAALASEVTAVNACVRIIDARLKLLALGQPGVLRRPECEQPQTVVLMQDDCRMRGCPDHT